VGVTVFTGGFSGEFLHVTGVKSQRNVSHNGVFLKGKNEGNEGKARAVSPRPEAVSYR